MFRVAIFTLLIGVVFFMLRSWFSPSKTEGGDSMEMVQDPQCKIYLPRGEALQRAISGTTHYFCSEKCADAFIEAS